ERGKLILVNTSTGKVEREAEAGYFPQTVRAINGKLYCSLLGENKLLVFSPDLSLIKALEVGQTPQDICGDPDGKSLYVVNTRADPGSLVDTARDAVVSPIDIRHPGSRYGAAPTSCAVLGNLIFITEATTNSVAVYDKTDRKILGSIPAG